MLIGHMDQAPTGEGGFSTLTVALAHRGTEYTVFEVQYPLKHIASILIGEAVPDIKGIALSEITNGVFFNRCR